MAFRGEHDQAEELSWFFEDQNLARSDSMEIKNDPRFFQDNVINYRLAAFGCVSVVSGLMLQNSMHEMWSMNKQMQIMSNRVGAFGFYLHGTLQLISFGLLLIIFFANMVSTYVGVAQPYHTIRLMTAGPTGFEAAASYYLNRNMVAWRHLAIKCMLVSLPLFISQMGVRLIVEFDRTTEEDVHLPPSAPLCSIIEGVFFAVCLGGLSILLWKVHYLHFAIFRDRYETMAKGVSGNDFTTYMQKMMTPGRAEAGNLDV